MPHILRLILCLIFVLGHIASGVLSKEADLEDLSRYQFLAKRMQQQAAKPKKVVAQPYLLPGTFEPMPGRSHNGDYFPLFPFVNQYMGTVDLDPSISRHIGADLNVPVPSWGMMDIYGRFFTRIRDTTTKFGYLNQPVNMLDLQPEDLVKLISDPSLSYNRNAQPLIPVGKVPRNIAPMSCKPPLCNPYTMNYALGIEHDFGGFDGVEGDIDVPMPISKDVAYRFPFSGNIHFSLDNITASYGHNLGAIDPFDSLFGYQRNQRRQLPQPGEEPGPGQEQRRQRSIPLPVHQFARISNRIPWRRSPFVIEADLMPSYRIRYFNPQSSAKYWAFGDYAIEQPPYYFQQRRQTHPIQPAPLHGLTVLRHGGRDYLFIPQSQLLH